MPAASDPMGPVAAEDIVHVVATYTDRVYDAVRRAGCGELAATEVVESSALDLVEAAAQGRAGEPAGWWFARAVQLAERVARGGPAEAPEPASPALLGGSDAEQVDAALGRVPAARGWAVRLRDDYDLPPGAVAAALGRDQRTADLLVGEGRLALLAAYDDAPAPDAAGHTGRGPQDVGALGRLADGSAPPGSRLAHHLEACVACERVLTAQQRARRLLLGLPLLALADDEREQLLQRVRARAEAQLPRVTDLLALVEAEEDRPVLPAALAAGSLLIAAILGVGVGYLLGSASPQRRAATAPERPPATPAGRGTATTGPTATPTGGPSPTVTAARTTPPPAPVVTTPAPQPSQTAAVTGPADIRLSPAGGPSGQTITVRGSGFDPALPVTLQYLEAGVVTSSSSAQVAPDGTFTAELRAQGLLPGPHTVRASNGRQTASASFMQSR